MWEILGTFASIYVLSKLSGNKGNDATNDTETNTPDYGVRLQLPASTKTKIPVVYGSAVLGGKIVDVTQSEDNQKMTYVLAISEKTGNLLSSGLATPSVFALNQVYLDNNRVVFKADGITVDYTTDKAGVVNRNADGLIKVWFYNNGSNNQALPEGYSGSLVPAYTVMSTWTANHTMDDLVFAVIEITYNKAKNITGLGNFQFKITNSMTQPGDCLYDYMTNSRYGAGIDPSEIDA